MAGKKAAKESKKTKSLFDTSKPQTVQMNVPFQNTTVEIEHVLNFPDDAQLIDHYRQRKVEETLSDKGYNSEDTISTASEDLWNKVAVSRKGYSNDTRPDWKEKTPSTHKEKAIEALLFVRAVVPDALDSPVVFDEDDDTETVTLEFYDNGEYSRSTIALNRPNAEQVRRYRKIRDSNLKREKDRLVETTSINLSDRDALYSELKISETGYAQNAPVTHRACAVMALFEKQIEVVTKN